MVPTRTHSLVGESTPDWTDSGGGKFRTHQFPIPLIHHRQALVDWLFMWDNKLRYSVFGRSITDYLTTIHWTIFVSVYYLIQHVTNGHFPFWCWVGLTYSLRQTEVTVSFWLEQFHDWYEYWTFLHVLRTKVATYYTTSPLISSWLHPLANCW